MLRSAQVVILAWVAMWASASAGDDSGARLKIGNVDNDLRSNGGCALQLPSQYARKEGRFVFTSDLEKRGLVNVNGADIPVTLIRSTEGGQKHKPTIGERSTFWYRGGEVEVRVDYVVTGVCPHQSESCGVTYYDAILTITRGKANKTVAAKGACGSQSR